MRTVRLSLTMVGTTDEGTTETMQVQAGRGLVVVKTLPGIGIMTFRMEAGDQPETTPLHHPLHHTVIATAPTEVKEDMAEEVVAEAEVRLQGTAATTSIRDDPYPRNLPGLPWTMD